MIENIEMLAEETIRNRELAAGINRDARSRLVWFVAISGLALLNVGGFAEAIIGRPVGGPELILLVFPWWTTVLAAVVAHILVGYLDAKGNLYFAAKLFWIKDTGLSAGKGATRKLYTQLVNEENKTVQEHSDEEDRVGDWAERAENLTFSLLFTSFVWSLLGPLLLWSYGAGA